MPRPCWRCCPILRVPRVPGARTLADGVSIPLFKVSCTARVWPNCLLFKQNQLITCFVLWISAILSPLSPLPSKLRGQPQAPVYAVSPLSPLVPAQNNDSGSKTHKHPAKCAPTLAACPLAWLGCVAGSVWALPPPAPCQGTTTGFPPRVLSAPAKDCCMVLHRGLTCLSPLPPARCWFPLCRFGGRVIQTTRFC